MLDPNTKKIKNQLEKQLKATRKRVAKEQAAKYSLLCQIYRLKGRCFACEQAGSEQGLCLNNSPECMRAQGVK
jgi:hypothetical protein